MAGPGAGASNKGGLCLIEQNSVRAAVMGILRRHGNGGQAGAPAECLPADGGDAGGDGDGHQAGAVLEGRFADGGDTSAERDVDQGGAPLERGGLNGGEVVRKRDVRQAAAVGKCAFPDGGDAVGNADGGQAAALEENIPLEIMQPVRQDNTGEVGTSGKRTAYDASDRISTEIFGNDQRAGTGHIAS